jgi:hypothetical protein
VAPPPRPAGGRSGAAQANGGAGAGPGAGGWRGGGGFQPSPEMMAARQAMRAACAADLQRLCAGQEGREAFICLRQNAAQASAACQSAMAKMPRRRPGGGDGGGAGGQGPG